MKPRLVSLDYQVPECDTSLSNLPVVIGSAPNAGIRLRDQSVSAAHCRIEQSGEEFVVIDLDSVHGTFINGEEVTRAALKPGDALGIGMLTFFMQCTEPGEESESEMPETAVEEPVSAVERRQRAQAMVHSML
jgi:pSer/pThr/pTyr-binding forkhead associated (FHA) protein